MTTEFRELLKEKTADLIDDLLDKASDMLSPVVTQANEGIGGINESLSGMQGMLIRQLIGNVLRKNAVKYPQLEKYVDAIPEILNGITVEDLSNVGVAIAGVFAEKADKGELPEPTAASEVA